MIISKDIELAAKHLLNEELVVVPTETVYGLAANFNSDKAIHKIFELKQRPKTNPLIVHISSMDQLKLIANQIPEKAILLAKMFWPGPLTMVLKKNLQISNLITANQETVAVRMPNHPLILALIDKTGIPLVAPSANPFTRISPTKVSHVVDLYPNNCPLILDGGNCSFGMESTIIGFENEDVVLYRYGALSIDKLEEVIGKIEIRNHETNQIMAPGMHKKHYSPQTNLIITNDLDSDLNRLKDKNIGVITFAPKILNQSVVNHLVLSTESSLETAMKNFYDALHVLDKSKLDFIVVERFPVFGLGKVINDRLQRAAVK